MKKSGLVSLIAATVFAASPVLSNSLPVMPDKEYQESSQEILRNVSQEPIIQKDCHIDVLFLVDYSGSMQEHMEDAKMQLMAAVGDFEARYSDPRYALAVTNGTPDPYSLLKNFTEDSSNGPKEKVIDGATEVKMLFEGIHTTGGLAAPEPYAAALRSAKRDAQWRDNAAQLVVIVGDEVPSEFQKRELYLAVNLGNQANILLNYGGEKNQEAWVEANPDWITSPQHFMATLKHYSQRVCRGLAMR